MVGGGSDITTEANRLGLPAELVNEAENFRHSTDGIYPDNMQAVGLFSKIITQWRTGPGGIIGLDYNIPFKLMDRMQLPGEEWDSLLSDLQIMERAALKAIKG